MRYVLLAVLLAGCETTVPRIPLITGIQTTEVRIPVSVPCIDVDKIPALPKSEMPLAGDQAQLAAGAGIDLKNYDDYAETVDKMLRACAK